MGVGYFIGVGSYNSQSVIESPAESGGPFGPLRQWRTSGVARHNNGEQRTAPPLRHNGMRLLRLTNAGGVATASYGGDTNADTARYAGKYDAGLYYSRINQLLNLRAAEGADDKGFFLLDADVLTRCIFYKN